MNRNILSKLYNLINLKIKEIEKKNQVMEQAQRKRYLAEQAILLKGHLQPHIEKICSQNLYFQNAGHINLTKCHYNETDNYWEIVAETLITTDVKLDRPKVINSLNESAQIYYMQLHTKRNEELLELEQLAQSSAIYYDKQYLINSNYSILQHILNFLKINYICEGKTTIAQIMIVFK